MADILTFIGELKCAFMATALANVHYESVLLGQLTDRQEHVSRASLAVE